MVRRDEARRPEPELRLRVGPRRLAALRQRLSRLHLRRHQPRRPALRHSAMRTAISSTWSYFDQAEKDTNSELNTFDDRASDTLHRELLPAGLHLARLHGAGQLHYNHDKAEHGVRRERFPRAARSGRRLRSRTRSTRTTWAGPATGTSTASTSRTPSTGCWATTTSTRSPGSRRTSTPRWPRSSCRTTATGCASARSFFFAVRRPQHLERQHGPPASTRSSTIRNFAGGEFSYWQRQQIKLFGVNLVKPAASCPTCGRARSRGRRTSSTPACTCSTSASMSTSRPSCA